MPVKIVGKDIIFVLASCSYKGGQTEDFIILPMICSYRLIEMHIDYAWIFQFFQFNL